MTSKQAYTTDLDRFAHEFDSEDKLRRVITDLLGKMGREEVRITHGQIERGKDIVFYAKGGMDEKRLFACVIKNQPITGNVESLSGAKVVLSQAEQAFDEPYVNLKGVEERVDCVYIISPYECSTTAIESIKTRLQRLGQVDFFCGRKLLDLFVQHWPEFLLFESGLLLSYLSNLRAGLEEDRALMNLVMRKANLSEAPRSFSETYIQPTFCRSFSIFEAKFLHYLESDSFATALYDNELKEHLKTMQSMASILSASPLWTKDMDRISVYESGAAELVQYIDDIEKEWQEKKRKWEEAVRKRERRPIIYKIIAPFPPFTNRRKPRFRISNKKRASLTRLGIVVNEALRNFRTEIKDAADIIARHKNGDMSANALSLNSSEFRWLCRIQDSSRLLPFAIETFSTQYKWCHDESLMNNLSGSLLITGPAGYGKTSFCKWNVIRDALLFSEEKSNALPVYIPLHSLSFRNITSYADAFFCAPELKQLLDGNLQDHEKTFIIRLYLDGLDEVTTVERQKYVATLARLATEELPNVQVILTARDHVQGLWLGWLPRINIDQLGEQQIKQLVSNWISRDSIDEFYLQLGKVPSLLPLMRIPLLGTLILALFRRVKELPSSKNKLYELFIELLSGGWDIVKEIKREGRFGLEDKITLLRRIAVHLHSCHKRGASLLEIRSVVMSCFPEFVSNYATLLEEILQDGIIIQIGEEYEFCHLSFQEFLVAKDLNDPTGRRPNEVLARFYSGDDWWQEVISFYIAMSARPDETEHWLIREAVRNKDAADINARLKLLRDLVSTTFLGYKSKIPEMPLGPLTVKI